MAEKITLTFLGTGSAIPTIRRNHPAMLLNYKDENILIDCGEGTQTQFRKAKLNPCKLTRILITHWHADHVLGLPGLIQTLALNEYNKTLKIYGPQGTKKFMEQYLKLFAKKTEMFKIEIHESQKEKIIDEEDFCIETEPMFHDTPTNAYCFKLKEKTRLDKQKLKKLNLPNSPKIAELIKGKTVEINNKKINPKKEKLLYTEEPKKITFILDTRYNKKIEKFAENSDLLICESTYSEAETQTAEDHNHLTSTQSAKIAKNSNSKKLILTHLSQRYDTRTQQKQILEEAQKIFKETKIARDLDKIIL